jgi:DNA modification methylase
MQIESVALNKIIPYIRNPRKNDNAVEKVASSIKEFGFRQPIVVDSENVIIAGHTRFEAAKRLGLDVVPIHVADGLTEQQAKAYRIADNRVGQEAEWDYDLLKLEMEELDNPELTGFDDDELKGILAEVGEGLTDPDYIPESPAIPVTVSGDLWELGDHRLLCGDATKAEDVERLMDGSKAISCITDPPYSVNYENQQREVGRKSRKQTGDTYCDLDAENVLEFIKIIPSDVLVMSYPVNKHFHLLSDTTKEWELLYDCVWVKHHFAFIMGRRYQPKHEPILIFRKKKYKESYFNVPSNQSTVFEFDKPARNVDHPTIKPIELYTTLVNYHSKHNQNIYEPFLGSGTTLIACEKTNRKCYGMEIDPQYCDVIITRWSDFTGKDDLLLNGKPFKWSERKIKKAA